MAEPSGPTAREVPPPEDPRAERPVDHTDFRVWVALSVLNVVAAVLAVPYARELLSQAVPPRPEMTLSAHIVLALVNAVVLALPATALGLRFGRRVQLGAPLLAAGFERRFDPVVARTALGRGAWAGLALGALILAGNAILGPRLEAELARLGVPVPEHPSPIAGILGSFGAGIGEETLLRLFLLTAFYRLFLVILHRDPTEPARAPAAYWSANVLAALVFGALHFGNAKALGVPLTGLNMTVVLLFNGVVGMACGELYRRHGIEAAMAAHIVTDLVIHGLAPALEAV